MARMHERIFGLLSLLALQIKQAHGQVEWYKVGNMENIVLDTIEDAPINIDGPKLPYYVESNHPSLFPRNNYDITIGNPLKGFGTNVLSNHPRVWPASLPSSIAHFKWPLNRFMLNDPDVVGEDAAFNWTYLESQFQMIASYKLHAVPRFWIVWPGQPLAVPEYLLETPYNLTLIANGTNLNFDEPVLKKAINQSIQALGRRYDGDTRIFAWQAGFFGHYGEWHTNGLTTIFNGRNVSTFPPQLQQEAFFWYTNAFRKTHVQFRYPSLINPFKHGYGYHDDSFTYYTLGGMYNGWNDENRTRNYFHNTSVRANTSTFWKVAPMGGEVRPDNARIFADDFETYTLQKQDFGPCADITHAGYMLWGRGFAFNNITRQRGVNGTELVRARNAAVRMGYSFEIDSIAATESIIEPNTVDVAVTIKQTGIAPFYYDLNISLYCNGGVRYATSAVSTSILLENGDTSTNLLLAIPALSSCLQDVEFRLDSTYLYEGQPIRWAQGNNNGTVVVSIPLPPTTQPTRTPTTVPTQNPTKVPTSQPTSSTEPTKNPSTEPTSQPTSSTEPSSQPTSSMEPTRQPTLFTEPTSTPTSKPLNQPTNAPTRKPAAPSSRWPSSKPKITKPTSKPIFAPKSNTGGLR